MGLRVFSSKEDFEMMDAIFKEVKDLQGNSLFEIARRYWEDPDYAEKLRQEIAAEKSKRKHGR